MLTRLRDPRAVSALARVALFGVILTITFSNSLFQIFSGALMALAIYHALLTRRLPKLPRLLWAALALFFVANLLSYLRSEYPVETSKGVFRVFRHVMLCLSAASVLESFKQFRRAFEWTVIVAAAIATDALLQGIFGVDPIRWRVMTPYTETIGRLTGPFHHANDFAAYLTFSVVLLAALVQDGRALLGVKRYVFTMAALGLSVLCLTGTLSRGAWIAAGAACVLTALLTRSRKLGTLILVGLALATMFAPHSVRERLSRLKGFDQSTVHERRVLWGESVSMIRDSPWTGLGLNTYAENERRYKRTGAPTDFQYAHNGYLQMAAETGLLGLGSFVLVIAVFFACTLPRFLARGPDRVRMAGAAYCFGILSFLFHSATDTNLHSVLLANALWLAMGLALAARSIDGNDPA